MQEEDQVRQVTDQTSEAGETGGSGQTEATDQTSEAGETGIGSDRSNRPGAGNRRGFGNWSDGRTDQTSKTTHSQKDASAPTEGLSISEEGKANRRRVLFSVMARLTAIMWFRTAIRRLFRWKAAARSGFYMY